MRFRHLPGVCGVALVFSAAAGFALAQADPGKNDDINALLKQFEAAAQTSQPAVSPEALPSFGTGTSKIFAAPQKVTKNPDGKIILDALELRDMDINDVFKLISSKTGLNIIAGKNVSGRVTIFLKNVEVHDALHIILEANDLAYAEGRGIIQIMPAADFERLYGFKFGQKTETKIVALKGIKAADAAALLNQMKSPAGKIVADEQSNTLLLEDLPGKIRDMVSFLATVDEPAQVKVFPLKHITAELLMVRVKEMLTPKLGTAQFDGPSNKMIVSDTKAKIAEIAALVAQLDIPRVTSVFNISYGKAEDIVKSITPMLTKDVGHAEFDTRGNKVVVTDSTSKIEEINRIILALDKKEKEVLIEARIIQVTLTDKFKLGVDWEGVVQNWRNLRYEGDYSLGAASTPKGTLSIGTLGQGKYAAVLEALETNGHTKVLSNPRIAAVNNQEAKILVGTTKPYVTTTTTTPSSGPTTTAESVSFIDVGVKLYVTPTIHEDGYITMKIKPEVSSAATSITTSTNNEIPIVDTSTIETTIRVRDGVTIVMGGLIKEETHKNSNNVPILGRIPLIGKAFRNDDRASEKTEIIVFLTPHIITGDIDAPAMFIPTIKSDKLY